MKVDLMINSKNKTITCKVSKVCHYDEEHETWVGRLNTTSIYAYLLCPTHVWSRILTIWPQTTSTLAQLAMPLLLCTIYSTKFIIKKRNIYTKDVLFSIKSTHIKTTSVKSAHIPKANKSQLTQVKYWQQSHELLEHSTNIKGKFVPRLMLS